MNNSNNRLFVAGIPFSSTEDEIRDLFSSVGSVVSVSIIIDKITNRSKGFGFIEMSTEQEVEAAIKKLNDTDFGGRKLVVAVAKPQEKREFSDRNRSNGFRGNRSGGFRRGR